MTRRPRARVARIHAGASLLALATIGGFWLTTVAAELFFDWVVVGRVKMGILVTVPVLIAAIVTAGATGRRLAAGFEGDTASVKRRRLRVVAVNGAVCLVPCAAGLAWLSASAEPSATFYAVQALELVAGATNLVLLLLNVRDGRRLASAARRRSAQTTPSVGSKIQAAC